MKRLLAKPSSEEKRPRLLGPPVEERVVICKSARFAANPEATVKPKVT